MTDTPKQQIVTTLELIQIMKQPDVVKVEAATVLAGGLARGSHVLSYNDGIVYDIGIDDEEIEWPEAKFAKGYDWARWIVDDVERDETFVQGAAS